jgi:curved DNA-binding protein CbpA
LEQEDLLTLALDFFGLERNFTEEEFRERYRELAKKFHPDSSEFTSTVLFNELTRSKSLLEIYIRERENPQLPMTESSAKDESYELYKKAKEVENQAILEYFEKTKGNPVYLHPEENPPLRDLLQKLEIPIQNYSCILERYPKSIWATDASDSLKRIQNWLGGRQKRRKD